MKFSHRDSSALTDAVAKLHNGGHDAAALLVSDLYRELIEHREREVNQGIAEMFKQVVFAIAMMAKPVEESLAKNYVKFDFAWDEPIEGLPFQRVVVHFMRDGGKTPHELREEAERERDEIVEKIAAFLQPRTDPDDNEGDWTRAFRSAAEQVRHRNWRKAS